MPPSLPVEIFSDILDLATSPYHTVSTLQDDQRLLGSCCLASKQLCAIAQPRLWSSFPVKPDGSNFSTLTSFPRLARHVRLLTFTHLGVGWEEALPVLHTVPNLTDVRISESEHVPQSLAASMRHLEHLVFSETSMPSCSGYTFVNLVSLTLFHVRPNPNSEKPLFPGTSLPALRALYVRGGHYDYDRNRWIFLEPTNLPQGQLDFYQVHLDDVGRLPQDLHQRGTPLLLTFPWYQAEHLVDPRCAAFEYFQLDARSLTPPLHHTEGLDHLLDFVKKSETIKSLSLPLTLSPSSTLLRLATSARDEIIQLCHKRGIDLIWRPYSVSREDDIAVSRDFWAYAKGLKRRSKQLETEEASIGGSYRRKED